MHIESIVLDSFPNVFVWLQGFNGADLRNVCPEAGMSAIRLCDYYRFHEGKMFAFDVEWNLWVALCDFVILNAFWLCDPSGCVQTDWSKETGI